MAKKEKEREIEKKAKKREGQEIKVEEKIKEKVEEEVKEEPEKTFDKKKEIRETRAKTRRQREREAAITGWKPKTKLGKAAKEGKIKNVDEIFDQNLKILESQIIDFLIPDIESDLIYIGQAKGKFGGGKRRPWRQTQKKTKEGNVPSFGCMAVVGNRKGYVGLGYSKAKETVPSKLKAIAKAKTNLLKIKRGCGSFECVCNEPHSIPFKVEGKSGSSRIKLMPAPKGTGLVIDDECKKILKLAGIKDVYSKTYGQTKTKFNLAKACIKALEKLSTYV